MSQNIVFNGVVYTIPATGDDSWGQSTSDYLIAIPQGALQKSGGIFTLSADVNFGANFGLLSKYFTTRTVLPATSGILRLSIADIIAWRNNANSANLDLAVNASDQLTFNGTVLANAGNYLTALTGDVTATGPGSVIATLVDHAVTNSKLRQAGALSLIGNATNALADVTDISASTDNTVLLRSGTSLIFNLLTNNNIDPAAAIAYSKLALTGNIVNADIAAAAAISYSKLNLLGAIVDADISASAAIAYSKLNLLGALVNADISASAAIAYSKLALSGSILNSDISASAAIAFSKLAALSSGNILVGSAGNVATSVSVTGDVTLSNAGVTAIGANKVTDAMLAQMATASFKGRATAGTGNVEVLSATQATALLSAFVGDSGAGGTKGLVPAPGSGDAAASKFLKADGTWQAPTGSGTVTSVGLTVPTALFASSPVAGSPVTTTGTLAPTLATQTAGTVFAGPASGAAATPTFRTIPAPTVQKFTSGSGTYTTPTGCIRLEIRMIGAGGGGSGSAAAASNNSGNGGTGGATTFGTTLLVANGGVGAAGPNTPPGGVGGTASLGTGPIGTALSGGNGGPGTQTTAGNYALGASGASSPFCQGGPGGAINTSGVAGIANTGTGGGGGGPSTAGATNIGAGGGAGGFIDAIINSPLTSYAYAVGAAGTAGAAGTSGFAGGAGGSGYIIVREYYQ